MKQLTWLLKWILKAAIFLALFAFALDNQHDVTVNFYGGHEWTGPLVLVILAAFVVGLAAGVLAMLPRWWKQRRAARKARRQAAAESELSLTTLSPPPHDS